MGGLPVFMWLLMLRAMADPEKRKNFKIPDKPEAMARVHGVLDSGKVTPIVARTFPLADAAEAMRCMQEETVVGRIILTPPR